jgi:hypothetical protein
VFFVLLQVRLILGSGEPVSSHPAHAMGYLAVVLFIFSNPDHILVHPGEDLSLS